MLISYKDFCYQFHSPDRENKVKKKVFNMAILTSGFFVLEVSVLWPTAHGRDVGAIDLAILELGQMKHHHPNCVQGGPQFTACVPLNPSFPCLMLAA